MKWLIGLLIVIFSTTLQAKECEYLIALRIDKSFTKKQKNAIERATKIWYSASKKRVCFYIIEDDVSNVEDYRRDDITTIYSGNYRWHIHYANDHGCIYQLNKCLAVTISSLTKKFRHDIFLIKHSKFLPLVVHELGHILGLQHSNNIEDLMYEVIRRDIFKPSKNDIEVLECLMDSKQLRNFKNTCKYNVTKNN